MYIVHRTFNKLSHSLLPLLPDHCIRLLQLLSAMLINMCHLFHPKDDGLHMLVMNIDASCILCCLVSKKRANMAMR